MCKLQNILCECPLNSRPRARGFDGEYNLNLVYIMCYSTISSVIFVVIFKLVIFEFEDIFFVFVTYCQRQRGLERTQIPFPGWGSARPAPQFCLLGALSGPGGTPPILLSQSHPPLESIVLSWCLLLLYIYM